MSLQEWRSVYDSRRAYENLQGVNTWWSNYWGPIRESFAGAWQKNVTVVSDKPTLLASSAVYACISGIAGDIAKMPINLVEKDKNGIWTTFESPSFSPVLRKPNHYQTRYKFVEQWVVSKLLYGNTYALKERDARGVVTALYILHPLCVQPLVAEDGSVYYKIKPDYLSQVDTGDPRSVGENDLVFPASEVIHDMMVSLWHPLVGVSPLFAAAAAATTQAKISDNSMNFFGNRSMPGGTIEVPGQITQTMADNLKNQFQTGYSGSNIGKVAVLSEGMVFKPIAMTAEQSQQVEQLKFTVEDVARSFHYPLFKLGGPYPTYDSIDALNVLYYSDCLQNNIEGIEASLDLGLGFDGVNEGTEFDVDALLRMNVGKLFESLDLAKNILTPNEQRKRANYGPVTGGDVVLRQQQDFSLEALAKRDAQDDPFASSKTPTPAANQNQLPTDEEPASKPEELPQEPRSILDAEDLELLYGADFRKELALT